MYTYRLRRPSSRIPTLRHVVLRYPWSSANPGGGDTATLIIGGPNPRRYWQDSEVTGYDAHDVRRYSQGEVTAYDTREVRHYTQGDIRSYNQ